MFRLLALTAAALLAAPVLADDTYKLTGENTTLKFTGTKKDGKHVGGFKTLTGTATCGGDPTTLKIECEIDCASLYSDADGLTTHLKGPDFFNVKENPKATFKSTKVEKDGDKVKITGDLTLLGKTKPVTMVCTCTHKDGTLGLASEFTIDRTQWGMTYGEGKVDNAVALTLNITAKK
jgi:polyisoprenoid-binding protein YceI